MEAFSLPDCNTCSLNTSATTLHGRAEAQRATTDAGSNTDVNDYDDDGPFFDLEFTIPEQNSVEREDDERETEFNSTIFSGSGSNGKSQFSLLKSATKIRVFILKLNKSKSNGSEKTECIWSASATAKLREKQRRQENRRQSKFLMVKFKVEEVPIVYRRQRTLVELLSDDNQFSNDVKHRKYFKMVKPLHVGVGFSRRYGGRLFPSKTEAEKSQKQSVEVEEYSPKIISNVKNHKQRNLPERLRLVVRKHLGKSRSPSTAAPAGIQAKRRDDDSVREQQDGIQSAILYCKRSFNASRGLLDSD